MKRTNRRVSAAVLLAAMSCLAAQAAPPEPFFTNVTEPVGLAGQPAFRISIGDLNGDGYPDLVLHIPSDDGTSDVLHKQRVYLNVPGDDPGDPHSRAFADFTDESGIEANRDGTADGRHSDGAIFADVDNDGDLDMFTLVYVHSNYELDVGRNDLMLNDGQGHFTLAPGSPFHLDPIYNTAAAFFFDFDNDGAIDLFIGNWYVPEGLSQSRVYRGDGQGGFTDVTAAAGLEGTLTCVYGAASGDYDGDGFQDIFLPSYSHTRPEAKPRLWRNGGDGSFSSAEDETAYAAYGGYDSGKASFGSMPRDYDNDGDIDFLEVWTHGAGDGSNRRHTTAVANVDGVFDWDFSRVHDRATEDPDINHHGDHYGSWFDYDRDGWADFALTECGYDNNRLYLFRQLEDRTFAPVTVESGMNTVNEANLPPHNASPLDFDLDGDEDLIVGFASSDPLQLWRNDAGGEHHWISISLAGAGIEGCANAAAIGARIEVTAGGLTQTREIYAGNGHMGPQVPLAQTFGLGAADVVDEITVHWPNSRRSTLTCRNLPADRHLRLVEPADSGPPPLGVRLAMPAAQFAPGDRCGLTAYLYNDEDALTAAPLFVILEVAGDYWFWNGWTQDLDWGTVDLPAGPGCTALEIIPEFAWPDTGADSYGGILFYGALLNQEMTEVLGGLDGVGTFTFGFKP